MIDALLNMFKGNPVGKIAGVMSHILNLVNFYETEFAADHNAFNAAIDTAIALLQKCKKEAPVETPPQ